MSDPFAVPRKGRCFLKVDGGSGIVVGDEDRRTPSPFHNGPMDLSCLRTEAERSCHSAIVIDAKARLPTKLKELNCLVRKT